MYKRTINLPELLQKKSFFLFGPRQSGKSTLVRESLKQAKVFDLLDNVVFSKLSKRPKIIEETTSPADIVVIDEIQKLPLLLDEVHRLIELRGQRFLLTGSSARKLKRGAANLLAGRAWQADLMPLTFFEIPDFDLIRYLNHGGLPSIYDSSDPIEELNSYVHLYLREEVAAEGLVRNLQPFQNFLDFLAHTNTEELNKSAIARDAGIPSRTASEYLQILYDTLLAYELPAFTSSKKRKPISRSKFYFFDVGVAGRLANRGKVEKNSELFGKAFEHFIINEVRAYISYSRSMQEMHFWRTKNGYEVDLIVDRKIAIEIKSTSMVQEKHLRGLIALKEEMICKKFLVVSQDSSMRVIEESNIIVYPWKLFCKELWAGRALSVKTILKF